MNKYLKESYENTEKQQKMNKTAQDLKVEIELIKKSKLTPGMVAHAYRIPALGTQRQADF